MSRDGVFAPTAYPDLPFVKAKNLSPSELAQARKLANVKVLNEYKFNDGTTLEYVTVGNEVVEGDMLVMTVPELETKLAEFDRQINTTSFTLSPQAAILHPTTKWPNGIVYVDYGTLNQYTPTQQATIRNAISYMDSTTNLRFVTRNSGDRIAFYNNSRIGCHSNIGLIQDGKVQPVYVRYPICLGDSTNNIAGVIHEFGHAVGLIHEHQRADRGGKLRPNTSNLNTAGRQQISTTRPVSPNYSSAYDYRSVMHYAPRRIPRFAINPNVNIFDTPGYSGDLGPITDRELSPSDVAIINRLYP